MRIGLLSDTHMPDVEKELPSEIARVFLGVDLILHAGDIYDPFVLDDLEQIAPVLAAKGDDDYPCDDSRIMEKHVIDIEGHKIWLIHEGPISSLSPHWMDVWCQRRIDPGDSQDGMPDIIIAGHEHRSFINRKNGFLYVNAGSPTCPGYQPVPGTVGIMEISPGKVDVDIIQL